MRRLLVLLIVGSLLAACGDDAADLTTTTEMTGTTAEPTTTAAPTTTTVPETTVATTTTEPATTTTLSFGTFAIPPMNMCVIDHFSDDALNVRTGPGTAYDIVGTLAFNATGVFSTGRASHDESERPWLEVEYAGGTGWAASWLLTPCDVTEAVSFCVIDTTCDDRLNIRVGPGAEYAKMGSLPFDAVGVAGTGASSLDGNRDRWQQIEYHGQVGWSAGWFLTSSPCGPADGQPCNLPSGPASPTCINGWITPAPGTALWEDGLGYIGVSAAGPVDPFDFVVEVMRYCVGPEDANIFAPRPDVERWYIEGYSEIDPDYRSRWIARRTGIGAGLAWVAPYGSTGFDAGLWEDCVDPCRTGNVAGNFCDPGCGEDPQRHPCTPFAPGMWSPGDCSGLPPEVLGCLSGL